MQSTKSQKKTVLITYLFIPMILLLIFVLYPTVKLIWLSFTDWNGIADSYQYVDIQNYKQVLFDSPDVWLSLKNNSIYFIMHLLAIPVEIFIAFLLDTKLRGKKFFKTITFMPYIINGVAVSYMFSFIFSSHGGALNMILEYMGMEPVKWLSDGGVVNYSLTAVSLWRFSGLHIILFLAGLQSIPREIFEAAKVDGANTFKQYIHMVLPNIMTIVEIVLFLNVRGALQVFDIPFIMTGGGPGHASSTFTLHTIETAFNFSNFGKASSMAILLMLMIICISIIQKKILGSKE